MNENQAEETNIADRLDWLTEFKKASHFHQRVAPAQTDDLLWGVDGPTHGTELRTYDHEYYGLLSASLPPTEMELTFGRLFATRKEMGLANDVLDVMGSGYITDQYDDIDSITGVRLTDTNEAELKDHPELKDLILSPKRKIVPGNAFSFETWQTLTDENKRYDVIICNPVLPFAERFVGGKYHPEKERYAPAYWPIFLRLLNRMYLACDPNGGEIFTSIPVSFHTPEYFASLREVLGRVPGIEFDIPKLSKQLWLRKSTSAPTSIWPFLRSSVRNRLAQAS